MYSRVTLASRLRSSAPSFVVAGDYLTARDLVVRDVTVLDADGMTAGGTDVRLEHNTVRHIARNGILLSNSSRNVAVVRNFVDDVG